jgi:hypothetical protein
VGHWGGPINLHREVGQVHENRQTILPDVEGVDGPPKPSAVDQRILAEVDELQAPCLPVEELVELHIQ